MKSKYICYLLLIGLGTALAATSCKKDSEVEKPKTYDASVDGLAIRTLPELDHATAERILREGPLSPIADATDESVLDALAAPKAVAPPTGSSGLPGGPGPGGPLPGDPNSLSF